MIKRQQITFYEQQAFRQWWLWIIIIGVDCVMVYELVNQIIYSASEMLLGVAVMLIPFLVMCALTLLFVIFRLETEITSEGIAYRFFPFNRSFKDVIAWESIAEIAIRKYSPVGEYGGWGMRGMGKNRAVNVSGNIGLQIVMKDGHKLLIGTRQPKQLAELVRTLGYAVEEKWQKE